MNTMTKTYRSIQKEATDTLVDFLKIPSVSSDPARESEMARCLDFLDAWLVRHDFTTRQLSTASYPTLIAEAGPDTGPTILFYAHYDVQDALLSDGWSHDPFDPVIQDGDLVARGASDDKGQLMAILYGIAAFQKAHGALPCRIRLILDGAEEIGSPGLEEALLAQQETITGDLAVVADCGRMCAERPGVIRGLRGLAYMELFVEAASTDLHSGSFGGTTDNPAQVLANMLSALKDAQRRIAVPGFYDDVIPPTQAELADLQQVPFEEETYRKSIGVPQLGGEAGHTTLARRWLRPTLDINGLTAGFQGAGSKTVLPARASCKLSCRIVPDQKPAKVLDLLEDFFTAVAPPTCRISFKRYAESHPVKLDFNLPIITRFLDGLQKAYDGADPLIIYDGATVPIVSTFANAFGIPTLPVAWGRLDDRIHGPDEKFALADFERACLAVAYFLEGFKG